MKKEINNNFDVKNNKMTFDEYRLQATTHDVQMLEKVLRPKAWENIPIIGVISYAIRMGYALNGIDRWPLRKAVWKWNMIFFFAGLVYLYLIIMIITPWIPYAHIKIAINETKKRIKNNTID